MARSFVQTIIILEKNIVKWFFFIGRIITVRMGNGTLQKSKIV